MLVIPGLRRRPPDSRLLGDTDCAPPAARCMCLLGRALSCPWRGDVSGQGGGAADNGHPSRYNRIRNCRKRPGGDSGQYPRDGGHDGRPGSGTGGHLGLLEVRGHLRPPRKSEVV